MNVPVMSGTSPQWTSRTDIFVSGCTIRMSAPEGDLQPAAERVAVDRGDHGNRDLLPHPADLLAEVGDPTVGHLARVPVGTRRRTFRPAVTGVGQRLHRREVETGTERGTVAGQDDDTHVALRLQLLAGVGDAAEHRVVERVALVGAVEPDIGDAIVDRDGDTVGHLTSLADRSTRPKAVRQPVKERTVLAWDSPASAWIPGRSG